VFFDRAELVSRKRAFLRTLPLTPETGWRPAYNFPDLTDSVAIGFDCEVKENDFDRGPGWSRNQAEIVGIAIDALARNGETFTKYYPVAHEVEPEYNLDPAPVYRWLKRQLNTPRIPKFGANIVYDIGNLAEKGVNATGEMHDCEYSEALCDEEALVNLDAQSIKYLAEGKKTEQLYQWCAEAYGGEPTGSQRDNIWRASPRIVGPYAETDAKNPRLIIEKQWKQMRTEGLLDLYRMECDLIPLYVKMRQQGVRVDVKGAEMLHDELIPLIFELYKQVDHISGVKANSTTGGDIRKIMDALDLTKLAPRTEKDNPSFNKEFLHSLEHPIAAVILEIRQMEVLKNTFLRNFIIESHVNGIIHAEFTPLSNDEGGTRTGRYSSKNPNLTQIPKRSALGKRVRSLFLPFEGHVCWQKGDFSQIQYRGLAHYAVGPGADDLRAAYIADPKTDYHDKTQGNIKRIVGIEIPREPIKNINFATMFTAGMPKVTRMLQLDSKGLIDKKKSELFYNSHHEANPYLKATIKHMTAEATAIGFSTSILGRRTRFNKWEPMDCDYRNRPMPLEYHQAIRMWGTHIQRANTYTAISGKLQGFEADIMKASMRRALKEGVYAVTGVPTVVVHDEKGFSVIDESPKQNEAYVYMKYIMENTVKARVPILFDDKRGPNWGSIK
jgi:DNA polymerase I-like protein with 3'-5' exonuclease and polymerase domains